MTRPNASTLATHAHIVIQGPERFAPSCPDCDYRGKPYDSKASADRALAVHVKSRRHRDALTRPMCVDCHLQRAEKGGEKCYGCIHAPVDRESPLDIDGTMRMVRGPGGIVRWVR